MSAVILRSSISLLVLCLMSTSNLYAQDNAFTCEEIVKLLEGDMTHQDIIDNLSKLKTTCDLNNNTEMMAKLVRAGADERLLDAILQFRFSELTITAPEAGKEVGATVKVEGTSTLVTNKHLWLFAQREGLAVWWPQGGEILVKPDNSWQQGAFIGNTQDIGFDFNLKVLWVDEKVNRELNDYVAKTASSGNYSGIPLPDGSPAASISVHKVRH